MTLSDALAEAYASAPTNVVVLDMLEFRHPSWLDANGQPMAARVVSQLEDWTVKLEQGAPLNAGQQVTFIGCPFSFSYPDQQSGSGSPEIEIAVDNVSQLLMPLLDLAVESVSPIEVTLRQYVSTDLTAPGRDPITLVLRNPVATPLRVTARAGFADFGNQRFGVEYTLQQFPTLI